MRALLFGLLVLFASGATARAQSDDDICNRAVADLTAGSPRTNDQIVLLHVECRYFLATAEAQRQPQQTFTRPAPLIPGTLGQALRTMGDGMKGFGEGYSRATQQPMPQMPRTLNCTTQRWGAQLKSVCR